MKRRRSLIALLLMLALLVSACSQTAPTKQAGEETAEAGAEAEAEAVSTEEAGGDDYSDLIQPFQSLPEDADVRPQAENRDEVTPTKVATTMFRAKFEGNDVQGSGEAVDGVYRFNATKTDGESWHVKLECNYPTVAGRDYFVTYRFNSNVSGTVKFGDFQEFQIHKGDNSITGIMIANSGTSYLDLQLGMLPAFTIDFKEIEVEEYADEVEYENALPAPINFERESIVYEKHDQGYAVLLNRSSDTVNVNYIASSFDAGVWKSRLYVKTGLYPELGTRYRILADVMCEESMPFEVLFNNGDEEKGYGALYGQELTGGEVKTCEAVISGSGDGDELILQFSLGEAPEGSVVVIGNVRVEKINDHYTNVLPKGFALNKSVFTGKTFEELVPDSFDKISLPVTFYSGTDSIYEQHDDGYVVDVEEGASSATMFIRKAPSNPGDRGVWKAKLYAATDANLKAGTSYLIKYDLTAAKDQAEYEACFDGDTENAYGALYGRSLKAGQTDHVEMFLTPDTNGGPLTIRLQLGKTDTAAGNTFTLSNVSVESVQVEYNNVLPSDFSYNTGNSDPQPETEYKSVLPDDFSYQSGTNVYEQHSDGYTQSVSSDGTSATLNITEAPSDGREVWKSSMLIDTGVTPEEGKKYAVLFDVTAQKDQAYEICFSGAEEKTYGALYGQNLTAGITSGINYTFIPETVDGSLTLKLQLGNTADTEGNNITVSNLKIAEMINGEGTSVLPDSFAYPDVNESEPDEDGYVEVNLKELTASDEHDEGYVQSVDGTTLVISTVPAPETGVWNSRFFVDTETELEAGTHYKVTASVSSDKAFDFEICYNNGSEEKGYGALYGLSISAGAEKDYVCEFDVPEDASAGNLVLQFQVGKSPANNTITVDGLTVEKFVPAHQEETIIPGRYSDVATDLSDVWDSCDDDYAQTLDGRSLTITAIPEADAGVWKSKLFVKTGVELEENTKYKVVADVSSSKKMSFEICLNNGEEEKGFDALYGLSINGSDSYTSEFTTEDAGDLILQFQLGLSPADNTFTVNSVTVEKWNEETSEIKDVPDAYENVTISGLSASESHDDGFEQSVSGTGLNITAVPTYDNGVWQSKLFVNTGTAPEAGEKYRVTANVTSDSDVNFEICYNNGNAEKGYGALYEQSIAANDTKDIVKEFEVAADATPNNLILQFNLGKSPSATRFTVNSVTLEKYVGEDAGDTETLNPGSFELWANDEYTAELGGDGSSASVAFTTVPDSAEVWKTKLFANTGVDLKAGKSYRISADVMADSNVPFEICYNDGGTEKGVGAKYGLTATSESQTVVFETAQQSDASLVIQFSLGNAEAGNTVTVSNINVEELAETPGDNLMTDSLTAWAPVHVWSDAGYDTGLTNTDSSASLEITSVPEDKADWKVKLFVETGAQLTAGKQYRIRYNLEADEAFGFNVFYNNGAEEKAVGEFYDLSAGSSQTVEHVVSPGADSVLNIQLMLGKTDAPNTVTVSDVQVDEIVGGSGSGNTPVNFWAHEDYAASLSNTSSSASLAITKVPASGREAWKVKLFTETGAKLKAGNIYRVSIDVQAASKIDYEICYNNGGAEQELGAQYGLTASGSKQTVTYNITPANDADLVLQLSLGNAAGKNTVTISGVKVEEVKFVSKQNAAPTFGYDNAGYLSKASDNGYITSLEKNSDSAIFRIKQAPEVRNAWNAKVVVRTGLTPESGQGYRVTVDINAAKDQNKFELFCDGNDELAYGALYEQYMSAGDNTYSYIIMPGDSKGELVLQLRFGETNSAFGNTYKISGVTIEKVYFRTDYNPDIRNVCELALQDGYDAQLTTTPDKASVKLLKTPVEGREAWKNKLFIYTGAILRAGQKYRISMNVKSIIPAPFEVCFNNYDIEKGLGGIFGLISKPSGTYVEYTAYLKEDMPLVDQLSLGNCTTPNTIIVSDVKVEKAGGIYLVSDTIYNF